MAETALDLSITQPAARLPFRGCAESGRISASSTASDSLHDDCSSVGRIKAESMSPSHMSPPPFSSSSLPMGLCDPHPTDVDLKELSDERPDAAKGISDRVAPIRPFKMYPMDTLSMYNPLLAAGGMGAMSNGGLPASVGLPPMYDSASSMGVTAGLGGLSFTPLTSHLLQRKRRQENRDKEKESSSSSITSVSTPATSSNESESESDPKKGAKVVPEDKKDEAYWERRRKNNEAAKRSRDARRQKEEEIALRAAVLEQENLKLRAQVAILKTEMARLHYMLYNRM